MAHARPGQKGLQGLSLRAVLNKKKISVLKDGPDHNALHWGHAGTTLAIKLPISFDLRMTLTKAHTKAWLWEGILAAVIETELKEYVETITKTRSQMKASSAIPAWAQRFKQTRHLEACQQHLNQSRRICAHWQKQPSPRPRPTSRR